MSPLIRGPVKSFDGRSARELLSIERTTPNDSEPPPPASGGAIPDVDLTIADGGSVKILTAQPSAETDYWPRSPWFDSSGANQIRVVVDDVETAGAVGSRVIAKQATSGGGTFAHPGVGVSEVSAPISTTGPQKSDGWTLLDPSAIGDRVWKAFAIGGNGATSPAVGGVHIQFRQATIMPVVDECGDDGGCPMPADIYNGEDFSSYTDEADFLSFVESEPTNFYNVWYGDDGSVEGASFDPVITFCGNPVVVSRWKAVSSGSSTWDITGYGGYTRFSNPIGDTGAGTFPPRVSFTEVWATMRFMIESGWTADDSPGFLISELQSGGGGTNGTYTIYLRDGRVIFRSRADSTLGSYVEYDLGAASLIVGTSPAFVEVTLHGRIVPNISAGLYDFIVEAFINPACSGGSAGEINTATPLGTYTVTGLAASLRPKFFVWDKFNSTSGNAQWPEKKTWHAQVFYSGSLT